MNWRASLLGALIVAAAGLAVGVVVGGKTTTETVTVTAARATVTVTTTTSGAAAGSGPGPATTGTVASGETTAGGGATQQYLADYLAGQGTDQLNNEASDVSLIDDPSTIQLKGRTYQHAVGFSLSNYDSSSTFQMPIAGFHHVTSSIIGLDTLSGASTRYRLKIYKDHGDTPNATVLYNQTFHGPSDTHPLDFDTQGATVLVLEWTQTADEPDSENNFVMADPVVSR